MGNVHQYFGDGLPYVNLSDLKGKLIAIEGTDGVGRSTHIEFLQEWLEVQGYGVITTGWTRSNLMRILLGSIEVSGWSGILLGLFQERHPFPVFTVDELDIIAGPIAQAFEQAVATERVFFSVPGKEKPYPSEKERIEGALFFRNQYLHVILTNHYAFSSADPGGGEERDPRDTKGMK